jgi:hypothetical protein
MNLKFTLFFVALFAMPLTSHAIVGGPFDGNDYSAAYDNSGVYQVAFRMKNGSGFAQWGSNVNLAAKVSSSGGSSSGASSLGSILNRSLIYFQGIEYFGTAFGIVDVDAGFVNGGTNGISDISSSASSSSGGVGGGSSASSTVPIVTNGDRGYTANSEYEAKITDKGPILRFSGKGQLTILGRDATTAIAGIATTALTAANLLITGSSPAPLTVAGQAANSAAVLNARLANLNTVLPLISPSPSSNTLDRVTTKITVFGSRKFFLSQR